MRIAVLIKQVPRFDAMTLGPDGRLQRDGLELEINPYCRRAVAKGVELARSSDGWCTVFSLGPDAAEDALREAVAWGADEGVLVTDVAFAGSDTLATARALGAALRLDGPWDVILTGRSSVDADTGQVGPQVAELLDLPFVTGVRELAIEGGTVTARCEHDDGHTWVTTALPALLSCAERLCDPAKVPPEGRAAVARSRIRRLTAGDLGDGPWGEQGSPTKVGQVKTVRFVRDRRLLVGPLATQVATVGEVLRARVTNANEPAAPMPPLARALQGPAVAVVLEPDRPRTGRELLGAAARLAAAVGGHVVALDPSGGAAPDGLSAAGADALVVFDRVSAEEDVAATIADWARTRIPWAVLGPSTAWGREVLSRAAVRLGAGLTGDAVDLAVDGGRMVAWKPAFCGALLAAITTTSPVQLVTVRPGTLPEPAARVAARMPVVRVPAASRGRVAVLATERDDDVHALAAASVVVGVGSGVEPERYGELAPLLDRLGAELAATRKVTDRGWLPRSRQVGITGRSIAPDIYIALGLSGKLNHMMGVRAARFVLAVNQDPAAPVFDSADLGIVGDWSQVVAALVTLLDARPTAPAPH